ncbi:hypothetical protein TBLA_0E04800 [Henningerozyma blattae CBS 6284]|uniref:Chromosome transmission fidelity protein 8 n=1 Tax=Henningerozyma blattae (strain ATCC 34711 / CBS 6284 / DSM 70876 / NBRC 10599 / NRRL Y-10934 / UCD 77-7) TaxID=1071380 RepID=I2H580_HENB6|nr:hypothetical protein TBLA_0E04800 [Tetrapisispora blattae CBS 6284]CCH61532.1 hypothetical protein TBLA_0E04800 [Tetrapisispora blattae CBS 6284]
MNVVDISIDHHVLGQLAQEKLSTIATPLGNTIIEIQGELDIPSLQQLPKDNYLQDSRFSLDSQDNPIVKVGILNIDQDSKQVTMYVGTTQRLLGKIEKLDPPLGLLHFVSETKEYQLKDVFTHKIVFRNRPLPIM